MKESASDTDIDAARVLAQAVLANLPDRWEHTKAVASQAWVARGSVDPADRDVLLAAAWLHDIGYDDEARDSGFHPLDGARLAARHGWPPRITALIAHHSGAAIVAGESGFADALSVYPDEGSAVTDALVYADQTTGPHGEKLPAAARVQESVRRHGSDSANAHVARQRSAYLLEAVTRVQTRLATAAD
jgi:putative nucleotidyltransferase with HDIG domain